MGFEWLKGLGFKPLYEAWTEKKDKTLDMKTVFCFVKQNKVPFFNSLNQNLGKMKPIHVLVLTMLQ